MEIDQAAGPVCHGLISAMSKAEVRDDYSSMGELLEENPRIAREIHDWFYEAALADLKDPEVEPALRILGASAEDVALHAAGEFLRNELSPRRVSWACMIEPAYTLNEKTLDYPFTFGRGFLTFDPVWLPRKEDGHDGGTV